MLDMKWIRDHAVQVQEAADWKKIDVSIDELLTCDDVRRELITEVEKLRQQRNMDSERIGQLMREGNREEAAAAREEVRQLNGQIEKAEARLAEVTERYNALRLLVPNMVSPDTPRGQSDKDNVIVRQVGEVSDPLFPIKDHMELGELHELIDAPRGVKVGGSRSCYLKGDGVLLHRAVQQLALDIVMKHGFVPMEVPIMVREEALENTGFFPTGRDQTYELAGEDKFLIGTSEVPLISYYAGKSLKWQHPFG